MAGQNIHFTGFPRRIRSSMDGSWARWLDRWTAAGVIDADTAVRIRAFEASHAGSGRLRWPILIALGFGALMICGGILLFVAANWDALSPGQRFALVVLLVASFHVAGALSAERFAPMSEALHAIGTAVLGAGIALAGQVFNLDEHWPGGIMLWAFGAGIAWVLLRHTTQLVLTAVLVPAWLVSEWIVATEGPRYSDLREVVPAAGVFLLALAYLGARGRDSRSHARRALTWLGAAGLIVSAPVLVDATWAHLLAPRQWAFSGTRDVVGLAIAFGAPLILAAALRRIEAWPCLLAALWVAVLCLLHANSRDALPFLWWAVGSVGLVAWGVRDGRPERVNLGALFFASTAIAFYFSHVIDKLGRSASLVGLGVLFLGGGWALERVRRRLVEQSREAA
jgi:uncharacterized membrane protein